MSMSSLKRLLLTLALIGALTGCQPEIQRYIRPENRAAAELTYQRVFDQIKSNSYSDAHSRARQVMLDIYSEPVPSAPFTPSPEAAK